MTGFIRYSALLFAITGFFSSFMFKVFSGVELGPTEFMRDLVVFFIGYYVASMLFRQIERIVANYRQLM